jgi:hypothetical protein
METAATEAQHPEQYGGGQSMGLLSYASVQFSSQIPSKHLSYLICGRVMYINPVLCFGFHKLSINKKFCSWHY